MKLKDLAAVADNAELLSIFKIAIKRAAYVALIDPQSPVPLVAWAMRARFDKNDQRADWYAGLVLEGALVEDAQFRAYVEASLEKPGSANMSDAALITLVTTWVQRFAARDI